MVSRCCPVKNWQLDFHAPSPFPRYREWDTASGSCWCQGSKVKMGIRLVGHPGRATGSQTSTGYEVWRIAPLNPPHLQTWDSKYRDELDTLWGTWQQGAPGPVSVFHWLTRRSTHTPQTLSVWISIKIQNEVSCVCFFLVIYIATKEILAIRAEKHRPQCLPRHSEFRGVPSAGRRLLSLRVAQFVTETPPLWRPLTQTDIHRHGEMNASWSRLKLWYANANTMYHLFVLWSQWEAPTAPPPPFPFFHFSLLPSPLALPPRLLAVGREGKLGWSRLRSVCACCFLPTFPPRLLSSQTFRRPRGEFLPSIFPLLSFPVS